jgi:succinate-acetate transporter protein
LRIIITASSQRSSSAISKHIVQQLAFGRVLVWIVWRSMFEMGLILNMICMWLWCVDLFFLFCVCGDGIVLHGCMDRWSCMQAGGFVGIISALIGWYLGLATLWTKEVSYITLPLGKFSTSSKH